MKSYKCLVYLILYLTYGEGRSLNKNHRHSLQKYVKEKTKQKSTKWQFNTGISDKQFEKTPVNQNKSSRTIKNKKNASIMDRKKIGSSISQNGRKSTINIHESLARTPVIYNSPNGKDYYVYVKTKSPQQPAQPITQVAQPSTATRIIPRLPSRTFLVTVYGEDLTGVEDKIRQAFAKPLNTTSRPCSCPCCQCACESPGLLKNADCSCEKASRCPCVDENHHETDSNSKMLMIFPDKSHTHNGACVCPCCMCSCSEPGYESYDCGCQQSPPVPCPCSSSSTDSMPQSSPAAVNNYCPCANQAGVSCPCANDVSLQPGTNFARSSQSDTHVTASPNMIGGQTYHVGPYDVQSACDCYCCPCSCPVSFSSENPPCSCKRNIHSSCTCKRTKVQTK